ncbi:MAG: nucleotide exchange factor GrpE [Acidiferrobacterales bacterium]
MNQDSNPSEKKTENSPAGEVASDNPGAEQGEPSLEQQLEEARTEAEKNKENYLLASAEAENIRKRAQNEIAQARKFAIEKFAAELLSVRDSLDLASATEINSDDAEAVEKMREGLELTLKQLDSIFEKFEISAIDPKGEKFNPDHHQAMAMVETGEVEPNHVVEVMQKGYLLKDRLLRPAMVIVAKAAASDSQEGPDAQNKQESGRSGA